MGKTYNVDENAYCKDKISLNFPEYEIQHARFDDKGTCDAIVKSSTQDRRDGLVLEANETRKLIFKLVEPVLREGPWGPEYARPQVAGAKPESLEYLESDDTINALATLLGLVGLLGTLFTFCAWIGVEF